MSKEIDRVLSEADEDARIVGKPAQFTRWAAKTIDARSRGTVRGNHTVKAKQSRSQTLRRVPVTLPSVSILKDKE